MNAAPMRFTEQSELYDDFRPRYPHTLGALLKKLAPGASLVCDLGAGTGILTEHLVDNFQSVIAVEPNPKMLSVAMKKFSSRQNFSTFQGRAEDLELMDRTVDLFTAGQSFHWFENEKTRDTFKKLGSKGAKFAFVWNIRSSESEVMKLTQDIINKYSNEYSKIGIDTESIEDKVSSFSPHFSLTKIQNPITVSPLWVNNFLRSASYMPTSPELLSAYSKELKSKLIDLIDKEGNVSFVLETLIFSGSVADL